MEAASEALDTDIAARVVMETDLGALRTELAEVVARGVDERMAVKEAKAAALSEAADQVETTLNPKP